MLKKSYRWGRLLVSLDRSQVVPHDPRQGTPAMVHCFQYHATYWCARDNGLEDSRGNHLDLTPEEVDWLDSLDEAITHFLY